MLYKALTTKLFSNIKITMSNIDEYSCRICLEKRDVLFSLLSETAGLLFEKLVKKINLNIDLNTGPTSICSQCLTDLDTTVSFLDRCEKSREKFSCVVNEEKENEVGYYVDISLVSDDVEVSSGSVTEPAPVSLVQARCPQCGSLRRCKHWAPPTVFTCPHCQKNFNKKFNLKLHIKRHLGVREWSCGGCGARQESRGGARRHCRPPPRAPCPEPGCPRSYTSRANLRTHLRKHYGERPFQCKDCEKAFTSKNTLNDHMRTHTGVKPYMCPICGRQFATNKLSVHMRAHAGERPHACSAPHCARAFATRAALALHAATHSPNPPKHPCPQCPAVYAHRQSLNKHIRQRHKENGNLRPEPTSN